MAPKPEMKFGYFEHFDPKPPKIEFLTHVTLYLSRRKKEFLKRWNMILHVILCLRSDFAQ